MNSKQGITPETVDDLIRLWESHEGEASLNAEWYLVLGIKALEFGHPSLAYDILNCGLSLYPTHAGLTYRAALALARAGSFRSATELVNPLLASLAENDARYQDTLSLAGRLAKDCYQKLTDRGARQAAAQESASRYQTAFARTQDYFPGINAATMSVLSGDNRTGRKIAEQVLATCLDLAEGADEEDYWLAATVGEAHLCWVATKKPRSGTRKRPGLRVIAWAMSRACDDRSVCCRRLYRSMRRSYRHSIFQR